MLELWRAGTQVVWAVREPSVKASPRWTCSFPTPFTVCCNLMGEVNLPPRGSDFALLDRKVIDALLKSIGSHPSVVGEIARLGFSQAEFSYTKERAGCRNDEVDSRPETQGVR